MKDLTFKNIPKDAIYKDVVIIGNGPSGITLSYMLAGNWPYWNSKKIQSHPDELLSARLNYSDCTKSLIEHDLVELSEGLEGRSTNPVSLLYDSLEHPCADLGMELPSMLEYKNHPNAKIDHVVLGKGPPGGSWHRMDPNLRTLSLAAWMSLPGFSYNDWETLQQRHKLIESNSDQFSNTTTTTSRSSSSSSSRSSQQEQLNVIDSLKIHKTGNLSLNNLRRQAIKNSAETTTKTTTINKEICQKCIELQTKQKSKGLRINNNDCDLENNELMNNNESEIGAMCCKCTKALCNSSIKNNNIKIPKQQQQQQQIIPPGSPPRRNLSLKRQISKEVQTRALVSRVAKYYEDYVRLMDLQKYFINDAVVTLIVPIQEGCNCSIQGGGKFRSARWLVCGINKSIGRPFYYACANIVLANGASDLPNRLGLRGEDLNATWVKHELPQLESALESLSANERNCLKPVLIVGAGLSAADAVTICRSSDIPVIHVFRSRTAGLDKMLPENVYPEYHEVHRMMKDPTNKYDFYTPVPEHTICDLSTKSDGTHTVTVEHINTGEQKIYEVSFCAILIGSRPDLRFISNIINKTSTINSQKNISIQLNDKLLLENTTTTTISTITTSSPTSLIGRKIAWLKNLCAKCKHLNLCDWNHGTTTTTTTTTTLNTIPIEQQFEQGKIITKLSDNKDNCKETTIEFYNSSSTIINENGLGLGIDSKKPIDCKTNQIAVNKFTYEILNGPKGLYAMGPLVGDNFVRFIPGGALAITSSLNKEIKEND